MQVCVTHTHIRAFKYVALKKKKIIQEVRSQHVELGASYAEFKEWL